MAACIQNKQFKILNPKNLYASPVAIALITNGNVNAEKLGMNCNFSKTNAIIA